MTRPRHPSPQVGDWIEARATGGGPARRGQITEVLGRGHHAHYRVRWDEQHESIVYPAEGVLIIPKGQLLPTS